MATPEGWVLLPLCDVADFVNGRAFKPSDWSPTGIPIVRIQNLNGGGTFNFFNQEVDPKFEVRTGDLLFSWSGTRGTSFGPHIWRGGPAILNQHIFNVRNHRQVERDYLYHALGHITEAVAARAHGGTGIVHITKGELEAFSIPKPPLPEQRKIAAILSSVDETIEKTEAVIAQLQIAKKAMMHELLTRGMPGRHTRFKQTEIGEIPDGWEVRRMDDVAFVQTGIAKGKVVGADATPVPYLRVANVQDGHIDLREVKSIDVTSEQLARFGLRVGDVLFCEGGDADKVGRGDVWQGQVDPCLHQNHVFAVRPDTEVLLPEFLSAVRASEVGKRYFLDCAKQTTNLASINSTQLKAFPVPLPGLDEQRAIVDALASITVQVELETAVLARLRATKESAAAALLSGELRVTPAEGLR